MCCLGEQSDLLGAEVAGFTRIHRQDTAHPAAFSNWKGSRCAKTCPRRLIAPRLSDFVAQQIVTHVRTLFAKGRTSGSAARRRVVDSDTNAAEVASNVSALRHGLDEVRLSRVPTDPTHGKS